MTSQKIPDISELKGLVITGFNFTNDEMALRCEDCRGYTPGTHRFPVRGFRFFHNRDCCESVTIVSVEGDLAKVLYAEVLEATQDADNSGVGWRPEWGEKPADCYTDESVTRTVFTFHTKDATLRVVWIGTSNGYYSESVDMEELDLK